MLRLTLIAVGTIKDKWILDGINEYQKRLGPYCKFFQIEVPEHRLSQNPRQVEILSGLEKEAENIIKKIPTRAKVITLCIEGKQISSEKLATSILLFSKQSTDLVFVIGSSFGLAKSVKNLSDFELSLSPMTFPHQIARLLLSEQIYRAMSIISGGKYHK